MKIQVNKEHYSFKRYLRKNRWDSIWHQIDEIVTLDPKNILEIGPGPGIFKAICATIGFDIKTLDIDSRLNPDFVESALDMSFNNNSFDIVCAFQMLEHVPYEKSLLIFKEMLRVARFNVVISLPDAKRKRPIFINLPKLGRVSIPLPKFKLDHHIFDGEHYWEINKKNYELNKIIKDFTDQGCVLSKTYTVVENPYHRFFIFKPNSFKK
jgi:predicted SAM-dependent methyltransferase